MDKLQYQEMHKKLSKAVMAIFDHTYRFYLNDEELKNIFFDNLSQILKIAFDLNLNISKLEEFTKKFKKQATVIEGAKFLIDTLENKDTYILLNYYYYHFIQSCLVTVREKHVDKVEDLIEQIGITEFEINMIKADYNKLVLSNSLNLIQATF